MSHTDIKSEGWITKLPETAQPYAVLMRLDRPIGWWLLLFPGWWSIMLAMSGVTGMFGLEWYIFALFFFGAVMMRGAGCIINDIWDRDLDKQVERTKNRPLASGQINLFQAGALLFVLLFLSLILLLQMQPKAIQLGFLSVILIAAYPYMKRITWWPQAFLGITFNFGALMGWAAVTDMIETPAILLYVSCMLWTIGYDTIYAHQDKDDDALIGVKSTALLFGNRSKFFVFGFYFFAYCFLLAAVMVSGATAVTLSLLSLAGMHLMWQIHKWVPDDPQNSLQIFKSNRDYGFLVLAALMLNSF
ncbi:MAG: 4-hydroxybenzoate octaprenyltransferase [Pseudomonadota bacterium]